MQIIHDDVNRTISQALTLIFFLFNYENILIPVFRTLKHIHK